LNFHPNLTKFFRTVASRLRVGGRFVFVDFISPLIEESLEKRLILPNFKLVEKHDLSANALLSLKKDSKSLK